MARPFEINGNKFSPNAHAVHALEHSQPEAPSNYAIIQTNGPINGEQKRSLGGLNASLQEYVGNDTYLVSFNSERLSELRGLNFVTHAEIYNPRFVVEDRLKSDDESTEAADVQVSLHDDIDEQGAGRVAAEIAEKAGLSGPVAIHDGKASFKVSKDKLGDIAAIDEVKYINSAPVRRLFNNVASGIMDARKPLPQNHPVYKGKNQIVCVADTGLDKGSETDIHPAFQGRVKKIFALGHKTGDDPDGHGTHVGGSVIGNATHSTQGAIESPASEATLIFQSIFSGFDKSASPSNPQGWEAQLGGIPSNLKKLFDPAFQAGARIHTNSWGAGPDQYRPNSSGVTDQYLWTNQDLVVLFAAGNAGTDVDANQGHVDPFSLGSDASAKNVITVGASESLRPGVKYPFSPGGELKYGAWTSDFKYRPISEDPVANNPEGLAAFSSRGPTKPDGRIKPDVVAPGTTILSARSRAIYPGHFAAFWGESEDDAWSYEGGTSMATPLTASAVAVIRGAIEDNGTTGPSAPLVKALLINGAVPLKGQYSQSGTNGEFGSTPDPPNANEGFGRVNIYNSVTNIIDKKTAGFGDRKGSQGLADDGKHDKEYNFDIDVPETLDGTTNGNTNGSTNSSTDGGAKPSLTLKVTLVWNDPSGATLQNDLDLIVKDPSGKEKHGNMGDGEGFDRVNNVEQVTWRDVKPGKYKVTIRVFRTTFDPQPFAYAWRIF
ncbi:subtilisin-like protease [Xylariales sp. PMI_506]|nr:subtilisin-like protease [Xylariales sp. PMI_506]